MMRGLRGFGKKLVEGTPRVTGGLGDGSGADRTRLAHPVPAAAGEQGATPCQDVIMGRDGRIERRAVSGVVEEVDTGAGRVEGRSRALLY
jgi:hypothetical protein